MRPRFVTTALGAALGGAALFVAGAYVGRAVADAREMFDLSALGPIVVGAFAGAWVGSVLGAWVALRLVGDPRPARTAVIMFLVEPPVVAVVYWALVSLASIEPYALAAGVVASAVLARAVALLGGPPSDATSGTASRSSR